MLGALEQVSCGRERTGLLFENGRGHLLEPGRSTWKQAGVLGEADEVAQGVLERERVPEG